MKGNGQIDRCVCFNIYFKEILDLMQKEKINSHEARKRLACCSRCRLCSGYIEKMDQTGRTSFFIGEDRL